MRTNPQISALKLKPEMENEIGKQCSTQGIRRILYNAVYHGRSIRKKLFVSTVNRHKRIAFAKYYD